MDEKNKLSCKHESPEQKTHLKQIFEIYASEAVQFLLSE